MHEDTEFITIICAVVENINYQLILGSYIVDKLNHQLVDDKDGSAEVMAVDISDDLMICDNNDDDDDAVTNRDIDVCDKAGYFVKDGILYCHQKLYGFDYEQLVSPFNRRAEVINMADETAGCHLGAKKTKEKIKYSFTWPTIASDVQRV